MKLKLLILLLFFVFFAGCSSNNTNDNSSQVDLQKSNVSEISSDNKVDAMSSNESIEVVDSKENVNSDSKTTSQTAKCDAGSIVNTQESNGVKSVTKAYGFTQFKGKTYCKLKTLSYMQGKTIDSETFSYVSFKDKDVWLVTNSTTSGYSEKHIVN